MVERGRACIAILLCIVFGIFLLPSGGQAAQTVPEGWTGIFDRADLERINTDPSGKYVLMNDIDLSSSQWYPLCNKDLPFTGTFDGNGYTIYGMTAAEDSEPCGLFSCVDGGYIKSLTVSGTVSGPIAGLLAGKICRGTLSGCSVRGSVSTSSFGGGLAGQVQGEQVVINGCVSQASVTGEVGSDSELFLGGIAGAVYGEGNTLSSCEFSGMLAPSGLFVLAGGMAGDAEGAVSFTDCGAEGTLSLSASQRASVGGIVGRAGDGVNLLRCSYRADWRASGCSGVLYLGGICGQISAGESVTVFQCNAYGSLTGASHPDFTYSSLSGDYQCISCGIPLSQGGYSAFVGGIVGSSVAAGGTVTVSQCSSFASLTGQGAPLVLGGVVGSNFAEGGTALVEDCYADGSVSHNSPVHGETASACGGIAGINGGRATALLRRCFSACEMFIDYPLADGAVVGMNTPIYEDYAHPSSAVQVFVENCYYRRGEKEGFATPLSGSQLSEPSSYSGFDFSSVWCMDAGTGLPRLISADGGSASNLKGDVDGNGRLTEYDARFLLQYLTDAVTLSQAQAGRADINGDGQLTAMDVSLILRQIG